MAAPSGRVGEADPERSVSFLELFYDLVYVVVIAQAARRLAGDISAQGAVEFAVVFGLIWLAWINGTLYYELHGREDGRTRTFVFLQMAILALLAVFTADAAGADGMAFALVYAAFLLVLTWLWYSVRRQDRPEYMEASARYLVGMIVSLVVIAVSAFLPAGPRLGAWAGLVGLWIVFAAYLGGASRRRTAVGMHPSDSMVERFDLLALIATTRTLVDFERLAAVYRPLDRVLAVAALLALAVGWWQPTAWLLALSLVAILLGVWLFAVDRMLLLADRDRGPLGDCP